jgi:hypothetical protein
MLNGLLCLDSKLDREFAVLAGDIGRGVNRMGSILSEIPQGRKGGVEENPDRWALGE